MNCVFSFLFFFSKKTIITRAQTKMIHICYILYIILSMDWFFVSCVRVRQRKLIQLFSIYIQIYLCNSSLNTIHIHSTRTTTIIIIMMVVYKWRCDARDIQSGLDILIHIQDKFIDMFIIHYYLMYNIKDKVYIIMQ